MTDSTPDSTTNSTNGKEASHADSIPEDQTALVAQAKDLLALANTNIREAEEAFGKLEFEKQRDTALALTGDDLQSWLLLAEDCTELVRSLPPEHLHQAIKLIGDEDALAIIAAASSEQFQAMMDVEWFRDGKLARTQVKRWLELLLEINENEADAALQGMDMNALAMYLKRYVQPRLDKSKLRLLFHMQQHYTISPDDFDAKNDFTEKVLHYLYNVDAKIFSEIMELVCEEDKRAVENEMYGGRTDRLAARGFEIIAKAERMLEPVDYSKYKIKWVAQTSEDNKESVASESVAIQQTENEIPFLASALAYALAKGDFNKRTEHAFVRESADVANNLLIAHAQDTSTPGVKKEALAAVQVLASVGLEAITGNNVAYATEALRVFDMYELFRLGWTLTREVSQQAWRLMHDPRQVSAGLGPALLWTDQESRILVRDTERLMSWRDIAYAGVLEGKPDKEPEDHEADEDLNLSPEELIVREQQAEELRNLDKQLPPLRLLTWSKLQNIKPRLDRLCEELDAKVLAVQDASQ